MQVIVDGWGRVIQLAEQLDYLKKLEFIHFQVRMALEYTWVFILGMSLSCEIFDRLPLHSASKALRWVLALTKICVCTEPGQLGSAPGHLQADCLQLLQ